MQAAAFLQMSSDHNIEIMHPVIGVCQGKIIKTTLIVLKCSLNFRFWPECVALSSAQTKPPAEKQTAVPTYHLFHSQHRNSPVCETLS